MIVFILCISIISQCIYGWNIDNLSNFAKKELFPKLTATSVLSSFVFLKTSKAMEQNTVSLPESLVTETNDNFHHLQQPEIENPIMMNVVDHDIYFYSVINKQSCFELERILLSFEKNAIITETTNVPIHLHIQSYGGNLHYAIYLIDLIESMKTPVYTYVDGFAASAATLISMSGKKRFITKHSLMLVHQLSTGFQGKFAEINDESENVQNLMNFMMQFYLDHTKLSKYDLQSLLKRDIWLNASQCVKFGFVDAIS